VGGSNNGEDGGGDADVRVNVRRLREQGVSHRCDIEINEGDIVYITGPSGAGKSVLLREIESCVPAEERINLDDVELSGRGA